MRLTFTVNALTEVLIIGDEDTIFRERFLDDVKVVHAARLIIHGANIMSALPEPSRGSRSCAFIHEEAHQAGSIVNGMKRVLCRDWAANNRQA